MVAVPTSGGELARIKDLIRDGKMKEAELLLDVLLASNGANFDVRATHTLGPTGGPRD